MPGDSLSTGRSRRLLAEGPCGSGPLPQWLRSTGVWLESGRWDRGQIGAIYLHPHFPPATEPTPHGWAGSPLRPGVGRREEPRRSTSPREVPGKWWRGTFFGDRVHARSQRYQHLRAQPLSQVPSASCGWREGARQASRPATCGDPGHSQVERVAEPNSRSAHLPSCSRAIPGNGPPRGRVRHGDTGLLAHQPANPHLPRNGGTGVCFQTDSAFTVV